MNSPQEETAQEMYLREQAVNRMADANTAEAINQLIETYGTHPTALPNIQELVDLWGAVQRSESLRRNHYWLITGDANSQISREVAWINKEWANGRG